jgi:hypothetical protein
VAQWKTHQLAGDQRPQLELQLQDRCRAIVDLPGVPEGTEGVVILADGFNWLRYRVLFDNGVELGHLDGRHLEGLPAGRMRRLGRLLKKF